MPTRSLVLELHVVRDEVGHWCPHCQLPSAIAVDVAIVVRDTLKVCGHVAFVICSDCHWQDAMPSW